MRKPQKKREHENKTQKDEKKEKVAMGLAVARETLKPKGLAYDFYLRKHGGTCLYVSAETLSHESPFPKTPRTGAKERAASAASCAAGGANSENSNKLGSENVNVARVKFS